MGAFDLIAQLGTPLLYAYDRYMADDAAKKQRAAAGNVLGMNLDTGADTGGGLWNNLIAQSQYDATANTKRYKGLADLYAKRETSLMGALNGLGEAERADLRRQYQNQRSQIGQNLVASGLGGTSVGASANTGLMRAYAGDAGLLNDRLTRERMQWGSQLSGDTLAAREGAIQAQAAGNAATLGLRTGRATSALNTIVEQQINYPNYNPFGPMTSIAAARAARPPEPSAWDSFIGNAGAAAPWMLVS